MQIGWPNQPIEGTWLPIPFYFDLTSSSLSRGIANCVVKLAGEVASKTRFSVKTASFVGLLVVAETVKQCSNYGVRYSNGGEYPVPQALHVTFLEVIKLAFTVTMAGGMKFHVVLTGMDPEMELMHSIKSASLLPVASCLTFYLLYYRSLTFLTLTLSYRRADIT